MDNGIIFIGPPCCGKSTIGREVADKLWIDYVSSGDIARRMAATNRDIQVSLDYGLMAPEYEMRMAIYNKIKNDIMSSTFILDGFPRTIDQMEFLEKYLRGVKWSIIKFVCDKDELFNRARNRGRSDDGSFLKRYDFYCTHTSDIAQYAMNHHHDVCVISNNDNEYDVAMRSVKDIIEGKM